MFIRIMKNVNNRTHIYTLRSDLLDKVVWEYIDYITNPLSEHRRRGADDSEFAMQFVCGASQSKTTPQPHPLKVDKYTGEAKIWELPQPSYDNAEAKIRMIVDILYRAYVKSDNGAFYVRSTVLKQVTEQYKYILDVLSWNCVISRQYNYTEDNKYDKTTYWINDPKKIHLVSTRALKAASKTEIQRYNEWSAKCQEKTTQEIIQATSQQFVDRYNQSLRQLRIDIALALEYIRTQYGEYSHSALSRTYTVGKISQKHRLCLTARDNNGRLYHIGTELQRDIKRFTNIRYTLDCKNSHPFLLSGVILKYIVAQGIGLHVTNWTETEHVTLLYNVTRYLLDTHGTFLHYEFSDYIRKILDNSTLRKQEIAKILALTESLNNVKPDVWLYIYDAASGRVWDNLVELLNEERITVKQKVFESVVYSYTKRRNKKKEAENKWLKAFIDRYPTVYDIIVKIKKSLHEQCVEQGQVEKLKQIKTFELENYHFTVETKDKVLLPTLMMSLESRIFTEILRRLFNKRLTCFGIHDAVAVINPKKMTVQDIQAIMMDVYKEYGMLPTLSVESYD